MYDSEGIYNLGSCYNKHASRWLLEARPSEGEPKAHWRLASDIGSSGASKTAYEANTMDTIRTQVDLQF